MKKDNLTNLDGDFFTIRINGHENTVSLFEDEGAKKEDEKRFGFQTTHDSDGDEHFGIWLSEEELNHRLEMIKEFYSEGMIPWVCTSCGKLWGGHYDVGSMTWFKCHVCGAEWEQINPDEVSENIERAKKPKLEVLK